MLHAGKDDTWMMCHLTSPWKVTRHKSIKQHQPFSGGNLRHVRANVLQSYTLGKARRDEDKQIRKIDE